MSNGKDGDTVASVQTEKKQPTKEQWKKIEGILLYHMFGQVSMLIDGYAVVLQREQSKMRVVIAVYVNGKMGGEDAEIKRRFHMPRKQYLFSAKYRRSMKRLNKRRRELTHPGWNDTHTYYWPWWTSFRAEKVGG